VHAALQIFLWGQSSGLMVGRHKTNAAMITARTITSLTEKRFKASSL
jgi:hypothetical protein